MGQDIKAMLIESYSPTVINHIRKLVILQQRHDDNSHVFHQQNSRVVDQAFAQRSWGAIYILLHILWFIISYAIMQETYTSIHLFPIQFFLHHMQVFGTVHTLTQKCGNLTKTATMTSCHSKLVTKIYLNKVNAWNEVLNVPLLKCSFSTEIKIIHLCWDEQLMYDSIINCISSLLSQFRTALLR